LGYRRRVSDAERELEHGGEHQVTPLELFFDLVFVFVITQVTGLLAADPTWSGVFRGMLVLAALWWAWTVYAWLMSARSGSWSSRRFGRSTSTWPRSSPDGGS
jgi:low temperature requirement protein LtrA